MRCSQIAAIVTTRRGTRGAFMIFADIPPPSVYFLSPIVCVASVATILGFVVALVLSLRRRTRKTAQRILRVAIYSVPLEMALLLFLLALDNR
jgi:hypothetical protein